MADKKYSVTELQQKVEQAVIEFMKENPSLLELDAHEQTISHRIAYYLEKLFCKSGGEELNVDCEYNKRVDAYKRSNIDLNKYLKEYPPEEFKNCHCYKCKQWLKNTFPETLYKKPIRPDILVHLRRHNGPDHNQVVIEIKKAKICPFDKSKLQALTELDKSEECYGYQLGVFLYFPVPERKPRFLYFCDGKQFPEMKVFFPVELPIAG